MSFPMLTSEWLHLVLYLFTEYCNSRRNIIILFWKYVYDIFCSEKSVKNLKFYPHTFLPVTISTSIFTATKFHWCIPRKGITRPQYQFSYSCVCERFIHSQDPSTYFPAADIGSLIVGIYKSLTDTCSGNSDWGRKIPFLGIFVLNFRYCVFAVLVENPVKKIYDLVHGIGTGAWHEIGVGCGTDRKSPMSDMGGKIKSINI